MKRIAFFLAVAAMRLSAVSCGNKKQQPVQGPEKPQYTFTKEDTAEILSQVNAFIERLDKKDLRGAVEMLSFLDHGDSIKPLDAVGQRRQAMTLSAVKGVRYEVNRLTLRSNTNNEVKMDVVLFDKPEGDPKPNTTSFYFRPVKFEGKWYLTVWDNITNTNQDRNTD